MRLARSSEHDPVNIGNPTEFTILECARKVIATTGSASKIQFEPLPPDDPKAAAAGHLEGEEVAGMGAESGSRERTQTVPGIFSQGRGRGQGTVSLKAGLDSQTIEAVL